MTKRLLLAALVTVTVLAIAPAAYAHDAPETEQSRWVMADWMIETFLIFAGVALVASIAAWKAGHFHNLDEAARIPLGIAEPDYYTPEWAREEEEWDDGDAVR